MTSRAAAGRVVGNPGISPSDEEETGILQPDALDTEEDKKRHACISHVRWAICVLIVLGCLSVILVATAKSMLKFDGVHTGSKDGAAELVKTLHGLCFVQVIIVSCVE